MYGILAIDISGGYLDRVLCTHSVGNLLTHDTRGEAQDHAADMSKWYQTEIRPNVVYMAVPLPFIPA